MRIGLSIRRWTGRELAVAGLIAAIAAALAATASPITAAPLLGRWLAISSIALWVAAAIIWRRHGVRDGRPAADSMDPSYRRAAVWIRGRIGQHHD